MALRILVFITGTLIYVSCTNEDCFEFGIPYRGSINTTISGKQCQRWDRQYPHQHVYDNWPGTDENFCRTFQADQPWCYTTNSELRYEFCYVQICGKSNVTCRLPGYLYTGTMNMTKSGLSCQRWDTQTPHEHTYGSFSHAIENYCRNFDREEPWCFTNDSSIRLELCDVELCDTPCLNHSIYKQQRVLQHCVNQVNISQNCSQLWGFLTCLKQQIENITGAKCSDIPLRSIALQMQDVIEKTLLWKIDGCINSACNMILGAERVQFNIIDDFVKPCYGRFNVEKTTDEEEFCRDAQRLLHCVISLSTWGNDSTCLVTDKHRLVNTFKFLPSTFNLETCFTRYLSEFPFPVENDTVDSVTTERNEEPTIVNHMQYFLVAGLGAVTLVVVIVTIVLVKIRKGRKESIRLQRSTEAENVPYESSLTISGGIYLDPDYETVEEHNEGYEYLHESKQGYSDPRCLSEINSTGAYIEPNNADGSYLNAMHVTPVNDYYCNVHPYLDLVCTPSRIDNTELFDTENLKSTGTVSVESVDETINELYTMHNKESVDTENIKNP